MSEIEQLTDEERFQIFEGSTTHELKLLRIHDAQAKRIAKLEAKLDAVWDLWEMAQVDPATWQAALDGIGDLLRVAPDPNVPTQTIAELEAKRAISGPHSACLVVALEGLDQTMVALTSAVRDAELELLYVTLESIQDRLETLASEATAAHERAAPPAP